jgi:hypothetical protein
MFRSCKHRQSRAAQEERADTLFRLRATRRRILDVRATVLEEEMMEHRFFRSVSSDEDGGNPANIAASEASNPTERDARAAPKKGVRDGPTTE